MEKSFSASEIVAIMNEWMLRYTEKPEEFQREWEAVGAFLASANKGEEPDYGKQCLAYMSKLHLDIYGG